MIKGGYKIVNFNGVALSGTTVSIPGIYDQIVDDYDKPVMVSGVSLNGNIMDDAYAGVQEKTAQDLSKSVELTVYGGIITVTEDDEVSFVLSKTTAELTAEIGELDALETTKKNSVVDAINEIVGKFKIVSYSGTTNASGNLSLPDGVKDKNIVGANINNASAYVSVGSNSASVKMLVARHINTGEPLATTEISGYVFYVK